MSVILLPFSDCVPNTRYSESSILQSISSVSICAFRYIDLNLKFAGAGPRNVFSLFDNDQALPAVIISIDQAVCQGFPEQLMHDRIVHPYAAIYLKRHFDVLL